MSDQLPVIQVPKPIVKYKDIAYIPTVGSYAMVWPIDHPGHNGLVSNKSWVHTSPVVSISDNGRFETRNTRYEPVDPYPWVAGKWEKYSR